MFLIASVLCPVLWYLWVQAGSANANFFFAITLTYALAQVHVDMAEPVCGDDAGLFECFTHTHTHTLPHYTLHTTHYTLHTVQVFLVSDVMYSFLVHRYDLCHGLPRVDSAGNTLALVLR